MTDHKIRTTVAGTTPYAWPWDGQLVPERTALVIVVPERGLDFAGSAQAERVKSIGERLVSLGGTVILVVTVPPRGAETDAPPTGFRTGFLTPEYEVVQAAGVDGFYGSNLDQLLRRKGCDRLLLTGAGLETCVHSTMRTANDQGYECLLVADACLAYDRTLIAASQSQVEMSGGIFGAVGTTSNVLAAYNSHPAALTPEEVLR